ncbi:hypothetical protein ACFO3J_31050 [Streptomyces polygonati]|uniref:PIN domain-containing protein n=1 Tax=Streptomyces polygonati TaxID=1617087 RepID=A0ABV8HYG1_9ACTN
MGDRIRSRHGGGAGREGAIDLLQNAGLHGHTYAIDATLAAVALRQPGRVTIFTSDEDDMRQLCGDRVVVVKL